MSRINTNVQSLIAQRVLGQNNRGLNQNLERLSTGLRINRGKDDPAGLIASEALKADITALNAAIGNSERADQVINIAEGGLIEVSSLLNDLQGLLTTSANQSGLSQSEKEANQLQVDSILQTIDRIAGQTSFQGAKLLNGSLEYRATGIAGGVTDFRINGAKFNTSTQAVSVSVTESATTGRVFLSLDSTLQFSNSLSGSTFALEIAGALGSREVSFASGTTVAQIAAAINTFKDITGVSATSSGTGVRLDSTQFGSEGFVSVRSTGEGRLSTATQGIYVYSTADNDVVRTGAIGGTFVASATNPVRDAGQDVGGFINGIAATGRGATLKVNTDFLDVEITLTTVNSALDAVSLGTTTAFTIQSGSGADFQLAGNVDIGGRVGIGIEDVAARKLGTSALGFLDELASGKQFNLVDATSEDLTKAQRIVSESINQISSVRGRLGAFQKNTIGSTIRSLGIAVENTAAANSVIADADFASETASLTRNQVLVQAATNTLSLANSNPQNALQLLG